MKITIYGWSTSEAPPRTAKLSGSVTAGRRITLLAPPPYPALVAADWFLAALRAAGITVHRAPVARHRPGRPSARQPAPALAGRRGETGHDRPVQRRAVRHVRPARPPRPRGHRRLTGSFDQVIDPSGNAFDVLTARSISGMLAAIHTDPAEAPLVSLLGQPWIVRQPEHTTMTGYSTDPGGQPLAYTVIINGQLYNPVPDLPARYEPQISH